MKGSVCRSNKQQLRNIRDWTEIRNAGEFRLTEDRETLSQELANIKQGT